MLKWNVKNVETVVQAVNNMRHNVDCTVSPQCITRCKPFGHTIDARRKLNAVMDELRALACDDYYRANGMTDYNNACERYFTVQKRRGYVVLELKS